MNKFNSYPRLPQTQRGTSLLEVLISVLIMAVGLLGIAAMQATALRNSQGSTERSQAVIQSYAIIDAMRANREQALGGAYNTGGWMCQAPAAGNLSANDRASWLRSLRTTIADDIADASICGNIDCTAATSICVVGVRWDESRTGSTGGTQAGSAQQTIQTRVRM